MILENLNLDQYFMWIFFIDFVELRDWGGFAFYLTVDSTIEENDTILA